MKQSTRVLTLAVLCLSGTALADFTGQTILGPLNLGDSVLGNNTGHSDDNDGFTSGDHIFFIWDGGDDVYSLNWLGGDLSISMAYNSSVCDPDLFLYTPSNLNDSSIYGITGSSPDVVSLLNAAPGTYYIVVDSTAGAEGAYELTVLPSPASAGVFLVAGLFAGRRRR